jgi:hypothetical protein
VSVAWFGDDRAASYNIYRTTVTGGVEGTIVRVKSGLTAMPLTDATASAARRTAIRSPR